MFDGNSVGQDSTPNDVCDIYAQITYIMCSPC